MYIRTHINYTHIICILIILSLKINSVKKNAENTYKKCYEDDSQFFPTYVRRFHAYLSKSMIEQILRMIDA